MPDEHPSRRASDALIIEMHGDLRALMKQMEQITGNGDPSSGSIGLLGKDLKSVERRVRALEGWRKWVNGVGAAVGAIFSSTIAYLGLKH